MLSADKRKDMEQMIETAIDTWLNSLTGISDEVRKQFRAGVSRIAEHADMKNSAWEVRNMHVCTFLLENPHSKICLCVIRWYAKPQNCTRAM